jgi:hypothetical protein
MHFNAVNLYLATAAKVWFPPNLSTAIPQPNHIASTFFCPPELLSEGTTLLLALNELHGGKVALV